ncbi:MAG: tripartite tricarboxylate transporter TctB family protein [Hyphomicrobiales bacterium]
MPSFISERSLTGLALLLIGGALYASSFDASYADLGGAFDPTFFPRIILMIWLLLALATLIVEVMRKTPSKPFQALRVLGITIASFLYVLFLTDLGFFLTSVIFCLVILSLLSMRRYLVMVLFSVLVPGSLVVLFNHILTLPLPTSPFTYLF